MRQIRKGIVKDKKEAKGRSTVWIRSQGLRSYQFHHQNREELLDRNKVGHILDWSEEISRTTFVARGEEEIEATRKFRTDLSERDRCKEEAA